MCDEDLLRYPAFFRDITAVDARTRLENDGRDGAFLFRYSATSMNFIVINVYWEGTIYDYRIIRNNDHYIVPELTEDKDLTTQRKFQTLSEIANHYTKSNKLPFKTLYPVSDFNSANNFNSAYRAGLYSPIHENSSSFSSDFQPEANKINNSDLPILINATSQAFQLPINSPIGCNGPPLTPNSQESTNQTSNRRPFLSKSPSIENMSYTSTKPVTSPFSNEEVTKSTADTSSSTSSIHHFSNDHDFILRQNRPTSNESNFGHFGYLKMSPVCEDVHKNYKPDNMTLNTQNSQSKPSGTISNTCPDIELARQYVRDLHFERSNWKDNANCIIEKLLKKTNCYAATAKFTLEVEAFLKVCRVHQRLASDYPENREQANTGINETINNIYEDIDNKRKSEDLSASLVSLEKKIIEVKKYMSEILSIFSAPEQSVSPTKRNFHVSIKKNINNDDATFNPGKIILDFEQLAILYENQQPQYRNTEVYSLDQVSEITENPDVNMSQIKIHPMITLTICFKQTQDYKVFTNVWNTLYDKWSLAKMNELSIFIGTFASKGVNFNNVNIEKWLTNQGHPRSNLTIESSYKPSDIYVIGLQNCNDVQGKKRLLEAIPDSQEYGKLCESSSASTALSSSSLKLMIFARKNILRKIDNIRKAESSDATAISFTIFSRHICFLNLQMKVNFDVDQKVKQDVMDVLKKIKFDGNGIPIYDVTQQFHHIFILGDITQSCAKVEMGVDPSRELSHLIRVWQMRDKLKKVMPVALPSFDEAECNFPATAAESKDKLNTPEAWYGGRVLYKKGYMNGAISNTIYGCPDVSYGINRRPVFSSFLLKMPKDEESRAYVNLEIAEIETTFSTKRQEKNILIQIKAYIIGCNENSQVTFSESTNTSQDQSFNSGNATHITNDRVSCHWSNHENSPVKQLKVPIYGSQISLKQQLLIVAIHSVNSKSHQKDYFGSAVFQLVKIQFGRYSVLSEKVKQYDDEIGTMDISIKCNTIPNRLM